MADSLTQEKQRAELDKLFEEVGKYRSMDEYMELLEFIKKFPKIAPYNAMLLHVQKPGSAYVASASEWRKHFNRRVKPNARPLVILKPFGPVAFVYELNDTEGAEFPEAMAQPFAAKGPVTDAMVQKLIAGAYFDGIRIEMSDHGTHSAGFVITGDDVGEYTTKNGNRQFRIPFQVVVNKNMNAVSKLATIYHELGHIYCGHLYSPHTFRYLPDRRYLDKNQREFEAESVCWLLCERKGIENPSPRYLSSYVDKNGDIPEISIDNVLKAVGSIEKLEEGVKQPRKALQLRELTLKDFINVYKAPGNF